MSMEIRTDIPGDEQESGFMNATLQQGPPGYEFSIAVYIDVPPEVNDQATLSDFLWRLLGPLSTEPHVRIEVEMGVEDGSSIEADPMAAQRRENENDLMRVPGRANRLRKHLDGLHGVLIRPAAEWCEEDVRREVKRGL